MGTCLQYTIKMKEGGYKSANAYLNFEINMHVYLTISV